MKRRIAILAVLAVLIMSSTCYAASAVGGVTTQLALEKVGNDTATVAVSKLNLREGPSTDFPSICKLEKGQAVTIMGKLGDWYAVYNPDTGTVGAVDGRYISFGDENAVTVSKNSSPTLKKTPGKGTTPASIELNLSSDEQKLLDLVNKARAENGYAFDEMRHGSSELAVHRRRDDAEFAHQLREFARREGLRAIGEGVVGIIVHLNQ